MRRNLGDERRLAGAGDARHDLEPRVTGDRAVVSSALLLMSRSEAGHVVVTSRDVAARPCAAIASVCSAAKTSRVVSRVLLCSSMGDTDVSTIFSTIAWRCSASRTRSLTKRSTPNSVNVALFAMRRPPSALDPRANARR